MSERFIQNLADNVRINPSYRSIFEEGLSEDKIEICKDNTTDMQLISVMKTAGAVNYSNENDTSQFYVLTEEGIEIAKLWRKGEKNPSKVTAYTLVNTQNVSKEKAMEGIQKIECVKEACPVYGVYDGVLCSEASDIDTLRNALNWRVRKDVNVRSTATMIILTDKRGNPVGFKKDPTGKLVYDNTPDKFL